MISPTCDVAPIPISNPTQTLTLPGGFSRPLAVSWRCMTQTWSCTSVVNEQSERPSSVPFPKSCLVTSDRSTFAMQVKPKCQKKLYSGPACILHGPGKGKPVVWNITANLDELRKSTSPWVDLH